MVVTEPREALAAWVGQRYGVTFHPPYTTIGEIQNGRIIAVYVFNNWTQYDVEISLVADRLTRTLVKAAFAYVTDTLKCSRATFRTRADNLQAQKCLERFNARLEGRQPRFFGDSDALIYGIMKEDFPYAHTGTPDAPRSGETGSSADLHEPDDGASQRHHEQHESGDAVR